MTNVLITGITGMAGSHLADYILEHTDWNVFGMCRWRSPLNNVEHLLERANNKDRISFLTGDLTDYVSLQDCISKSKPDYVFHLAAQSFPRTSFESPLQTYETNILGTAKLLEALRHNKSVDPIIHVCSSSEVFGRVPRDKSMTTEYGAFHPASPYAVSKIGTDIIGQLHAEVYKQKILITRMFTHTGPRRGDVFVESTFAKQIAMIEAGQLEPILKVGNLDAMRAWADVRDTVRAYFLLVTVDPVPGEIYNIGEYNCTVKDMLDTLLSLSTLKDIRVETDPERLRPVDADLELPSCTKFKDKTSWKPEIPFEQTMKDLLDYWRKRIANGERFLTR